MNLKEMFVVAYAYEFTNSNLSASSGSHEIMLGINFCKDKPKEIVKVEPAPAVVPEPVVEEVNPEPIIEPIIDPVPEPAPVVEEDITQKKFDVVGANDEFNKRKNIIRYEKSVSANTTSANETRLVDLVVGVLTTNPDLKVVVEGHTCDIGSESINQSLSEKRAKKIVDLITAKGIDKSRVSAVGKGESSPREPNTSEANRVENRRVQLSFTK